MTNTNSIKMNKHSRAVIPFIPDADFYFSKGVDAFYKRKFDIAIKWIKKAADAEPNETLYPAQMSIIYTEMGAYHIANQILTDVIASHGEDYIDCYYFIANNYAHLGLLKEAQKYAAIYLEKDPDGEFSSEAEQLVTLLEFTLSDDEDFDLLEEDEILIYQETAFYHLQRKEWEQACLILTEMRNHFPDYTLAQHQYYYALFFSGEHKQAIKEEELLYQENPHSINTITNLIVFYYEENMTEQTNYLVEKLTNIFPMHFDQSLKIAVTLSHVNCYEQAYQRFSRLPKDKVKNHFDFFRCFAKVAYVLNYQDLAEEIWVKGCKLHNELRNEPLPWLS